MPLTQTQKSLNQEIAELRGCRDIQPNANTPTGKALCGTMPDGHEGPCRNGRGYIPAYDSDPRAALELLVHTMQQGRFWWAKLEMQTSALVKIFDIRQDELDEIEYFSQIDDTDKVRALCGSIACACRDALRAWREEKWTP